MTGETGRQARTGGGVWPIRSFLFVPSHRRDWVQKAIRSRPGAVILDLEDSVPVVAKAQARDLLRSEIEELAGAGISAIVRLNPLTDETGVEVAAAMGAGLTAVMLPKASNASQVQRLHDLISYHEGAAAIPHGTVAILPLPETAEGLQRAECLAGASTRVKGLVGSISGPVSGDIARAFGFRATMGGQEQLYMNSKLVLDSRAGGAPYPIAGVFGVPMSDLAAVEAMVRRARDIGYTGCPVMHPSHVAIVESVFCPNAEEVAYYEGLIAAFDAAERAGLAAVNYQGAMIDYAMLPLAHEVLADARRHSRTPS